MFFLLEDSSDISPSGMRRRCAIANIRPRSEFSKITDWVMARPLCPLSKIHFLCNFAKGGYHKSFGAIIVVFWLSQKSSGFDNHNYLLLCRVFAHCAYEIKSSPNHLFPKVVAKAKSWAFDVWRHWLHNKRTQYFEGLIWNTSFSTRLWIFVFFLQVG